MTGVLVSRLARLLAVLLAVTAASFCMVSLLPGDTVTAMLGANASAEDRDAALLATLSPGSYTCVVSGVNNTTGTALVEVYEVP